MFPLYSDRPLEKFPFVTIMLIAANIAAFWYQVTHAGSWYESLHASVQAFGMTPVTVLSGGSAGMHGEIPAWTTLLTSMFMHGVLVHL